MPTVPRRDPASTVDLKSYPDVGVTGGATEETFGGGPSAAALSAATKGVTDIGLKLAIQQRDDADKTAAQQFDVAAVQKKNEITQNITNNYRGNDALKAEDYAKEEWSSFIRGQEKAIPNDRVAQMMGRKYASYYGQIDNHTTTHVSSQMEAVKSETYKANSDIKIQDAASNWNSPGIRDQAIIDLKANVEKRMNEIGIHDKKDPIYKAELDKQMSDMHKATVEAMLASGPSPVNQNAARKYVQKHQKEMLGKDGSEMQNYVENKIKQMETDQNQAIKKNQEDNYHEYLIGLNDGTKGLTEAVKMQREINPATGAPYLSDADFLHIVNLTTNGAYINRTEVSKLGKAGDASFPVSVEDAFNKGQEAVLTRTINGEPASSREIDGYLTEMKASKLLNPLDYNSLMKRVKSTPPTLEEQAIATQGNYIKEQASKYVKGGIFGTGIFADEAVNRREVDALVKQFYNEVDKKNLVGQDIVDLANRFVEQHFGKNFPDMANVPPDKRPHIEYSTAAGIRKILAPGTPTKLKGALTWNPETAKPVKKEEKK